ncbi:sigma-70 family RNA polymerase sigma factor [Xylanimonas oleitrophica]|uniref:sigma-70 family RNA polymerase sigma factor n=1 Tax=Xylanimonas oleitrophica TaxID=2607479 RepID=UPI0015CFC7F9|nr:sigma-70 family RNA polymerase sigma factor [Xylanimonas oleitrophica]
MGPEQGDGALLASLRDGDDAAYAELWRRHHDAGLRAARAITGKLDPEDVVQEAFARVLAAVRRGNGPQGAFRPYLYAVVRNVTADWGRAQDHVVPTDDVPGDDQPADPFDDAVLERTVVGTAFRSLRPEWQEVLWYLEVEGLSTRETAAHLGLSPNAVAALAYRARDGLRTAWLQAHLNHLAADDGCRWTVEHLGSYQRRALRRRDTARVEEHLKTCPTCPVLVGELERVAGGLRAVLLPLVLGAATAGDLLPAAGAAGAVGGTGTAATTTAGTGSAGTGSAEGSTAGAGASAGAPGRSGAARTVPPVVAVVLALALVGGIAAAATLTARGLFDAPGSAETVTAGEDASGDATPPAPAGTGGHAAGPAAGHAGSGTEPGSTDGALPDDPPHGLAAPRRAAPGKVAASTVAPGTVAQPGQASEPATSTTPAAPSPATPQNPAVPQNPGTPDPADLPADPAADDKPTAPPVPPPAGPAVPDTGPGSGPDDGPDEDGTPPGPQEPQQPQEPQDPEAPVVATPVVLAADTSDGLYMPLLSGEGTPGAEVLVRDASGAVVACTTVAVDGTWAVSADVEPGVTVLTASQVLDGVESALTGPVGPFDLEVPQILHMADGGTTAPVVTFHGPAGRSVQALVDGRPTSTVHRLGAEPLVRVIQGQAPGEHVFGVRFFDPVTGRYGAQATRSFVVR